MDRRIKVRQWVALGIAIAVFSGVIYLVIAQLNSNSAAQTNGSKATTSNDQAQGLAAGITAACIAGKITGELCPQAQNVKANPQVPVQVEGPAGTNGLNGITPPCVYTPSQCQGANGVTPSLDLLRSLIAPLIPAPVPGPMGIAGINGINGVDGVDGTNGTNGTNGTSPPCLATSSQCQGADGTNGKDGNDGTTFVPVSSDFKWEGTGDSATCHNLVTYSPSGHTESGPIDPAFCDQTPVPPDPPN